MFFDCDEFLWRAAGFFSLFTLSSSLLTTFLPLLFRQIFHLLFVIFALRLIPSSALSMRFFFFLIVINIIISNIIALGQIDSLKVLLYSTCKTSIVRYCQDRSVDGPSKLHHHHHHNICSQFLPSHSRLYSCFSSL
jgi:hypothetical protein